MYISKDGHAPNRLGMYDLTSAYTLWRSKLSPPHSFIRATWLLSWLWYALFPMCDMPYVMYAHFCAIIDDRSVLCMWWQRFAFTYNFNSVTFMKRLSLRIRFILECQGHSYIKILACQKRHMFVWKAEEFVTVDDNHSIIVTWRTSYAWHDACHMHDVTGLIRVHTWTTLKPRNSRAATPLILNFIFVRDFIHHATWLEYVRAHLHNCRSKEWKSLYVWYNAIHIRQ